jgi:hypothetical protein
MTLKKKRHSGIHQNYVGYVGIVAYIEMLAFEGHVSSEWQGDSSRSVGKRGNQAGAGA